MQAVGADRGMWRLQGVRALRPSSRVVSWLAPLVSVWPSCVLTAQVSSCSGPTGASEQVHTRRCQRCMKLAVSGVAGGTEDDQANLLSPLLGKDPDGAS